MNGPTRPESLAEALAVMAREPRTPVAGGTDLMVRHRRHGPMAVRLDPPPLFIGHLGELRRITVTADTLSAGAAVRLSELETHPQTPAGLLLALREFAAPAIRNAGTIGGNICNASPAADTLPYLYAVDAQVVLTTATGDRSVPVSDFISGPGTTTRAADELLSRIIIPLTNAPFAFYRKVAPRRSNALSKLSLYAQAHVEGAGRDRRVQAFRLAIGAVAPTVVRSREAEQLLEGATVSQTAGRAQEIVEVLSPLIKPIDDQRSTAEYRKNTALALVRHVIEQLENLLEKP